MFVQSPRVVSGKHACPVAYLDEGGLGRFWVYAINWVVVYCGPRSGNVCGNLCPCGRNPVAAVVCEVVPLSTSFPTCQRSCGGIVQLEVRRLVRGRRRRLF